MVVTDTRGLIQGWNGIATQLLGWSREEVLERPVVDLLVPERYRAVFAERLEKLANEQRSELIGARIEVTACCRDGREIPIELGVMTMAADDGAMLVIGFARDITERERARAEIESHTAELLKVQDQLRRREELYRHVVELSNLLPWTADQEGQVVMIGHRWEDWTGMPVPEALGLGWLRCTHPEDRERVEREWLAAARTGERLSIEWRLRTRDGQYRWCEGKTTKLTAPQPGETIWYGTLEDIHDRKVAEEASSRAQAELIHVSRLSAMDAMASVIAHDLNQPLTAAAQYVRGSRRLLTNVSGSAVSDIEAALDDAGRSIVRASEIVRRMREFVTRGSVEVAREDLADLIHEACRLALTDAATRRIQHHVELDRSCEVLVDRIQIQQVLVNLLRNAVHALEGQSRREILISSRQDRPGQCTVSVSDTGKGLSPQAAERMFDPFYTTRKEGMGIGLSISRMIIEAHGGDIWNASVPGGGTVISFTLPLAAAEAIG